MAAGAFRPMTEGGEGGEATHPSALPLVGYSGGSCGGVAVLVRLWEVSGAGMGMGNWPAVDTEG